MKLFQSQKSKIPSAKLKDTEVGCWPDGNSVLIHFGSAHGVGGNENYIQIAAPDFKELCEAMIEADPKAAEMAFLAVLLAQTKK